MVAAAGVEAVIVVTKSAIAVCVVVNAVRLRQEQALLVYAGPSEVEVGNAHEQAELKRLGTAG